MIKSPLFALLGELVVISESVGKVLKPKLNFKHVSRLVEVSSNFVCAQVLCWVGAPAGDAGRRARGEVSRPGSRQLGMDGLGEGSSSFSWPLAAGGGRRLGPVEPLGLLLADVRRRRAVLLSPLRQPQAPARRQLLRGPARQVPVLPHRRVPAGR